MYCGHAERDVWTADVSGQYEPRVLSLFARCLFVFNKLLLCIHHVQYRRYGFESSAEKYGFGFYAPYS
jgi:hypothetical protein